MNDMTTSGMRGFWTVLVDPYYPSLQGDIRPTCMAMAWWSIIICLRLRPVLLAASIFRSPVFGHGVRTVKDAGILVLGSAIRGLSSAGHDRVDAVRHADRMTLRAAVVQAGGDLMIPVMKRLGLICVLVRCLRSCVLRLRAPVLLAVFTVPQAYRIL